MKKISTFIRDNHNRNWFCLTIIFLFCFFSFALPLSYYGLPSGYDMLTDIRFATAFRDAMSTGHFFPGWANDNLGFGSIGIRFYPPIAFYLLAFGEMATGSWFNAIWINLLFWMFVGCTGIYFFVKEWGSPLQGLMAALVYAVVPQHLNEIFQFFLFAEFAAWGVLPFCFLFVTRICRNGRWLDTFLFALSYSVLILTHIPTTIVASLCFPVYVLSVMDWRRYKRVFVRLGTSIGLTLLATSFRWVTVISEYNWLQHNDPKYATGYFEFSSWLFPNVLENRRLFIYVLTSWLFDLSIIMTVALMVPAFIYLVRKVKTNGDVVWRIQAAAVVTALFAFFMLSRPSEFIWSNLAFLQKIQFPWRWLTVLCLLAVVTFSLAVPRLLLMFPGKERFVAYPALALVVMIIMFNITQIIIPSNPIPAAQFSKVQKELDTEPIFEGWWPAWAKEGAFKNNEKITAGNRLVEVGKWVADERAFTVQQGEPVNLRISTFYYPYWKATVNDAPVNVEMDENGAIVVPVKAEVSRVVLRFEEPSLVKFATVISLTIWLLFMFVGIMHLGKLILSTSERLPLLEGEYS